MNYENFNMLRMDERREGSQEGMQKQKQKDNALIKQLYSRIEELEKKVANG